MLEPRVGDDVDDVGAVAELAELVQSEEAHAGEVGFHAEHAVELDGMADRFVNLQAELGAFEDDGALAFGTHGGLVQRGGLFGDLRRVAHQVQRFDQLVAGELMLAAETGGIGALLNFVSGKTHGHDARAGVHLQLMNPRADRGGVPLLDAAELHGSFGERDAGNPAHCRVGRQQQVQAGVRGESRTGP